MVGLAPSKIPLMTVLETTYINPHFKKIRFEGNIIGMDFQVGYAVAVRVSDTEYRNYTASFADTKTGMLEIIVHLHHNAPGATFMAALDVDDTIRVSMPRGKKIYDPAVKKHHIFGDETSLGLACAFLPLLKKGNHSYHFYFELDAENKSVPGLLGIENYSVFEKRETFQNEELIAELLIDIQECNFIITGNALSAQTIRKVLKRNTVKGKIYTQAYWANGKKGL